MLTGGDGGDDLDVVGGVPLGGDSLFGGAFSHGHGTSGEDGTEVGGGSDLGVAGTGDGDGGSAFGFGGVDFGDGVGVGVGVGVGDFGDGVDGDFGFVGVCGT